MEQLVVHSNVVLAAATFVAIVFVVAWSLSMWRHGSSGNRLWLDWFWRADKHARWRGLRRGMARRLPTLAAAPVRRCVQACCLILFLVLFLYVSWPYTAAPAPPGSRSSGWQFLGIAGETGRFQFHGPAVPEWARPSAAVYVVDSSAATAANGLAGRFTVASSSAHEVELEPPSALGPEQLDRFLLATGTWELHERLPGAWPSHYTDDLRRKQRAPAELFLLIDPLVSLSTAVAARTWVWSLVWAVAILIAAIIVPRGFCGYLCPLGTLIDLFDWVVGRHLRWLRVASTGWWVHIKYYILLAILVAAALGVLLAGYVAAIPVAMRGLMFTLEPLQNGWLRGWHLVPAFNIGHGISLAMFAAVFLLGLLGPRFWCKYICPSGACFSIGNLLRLSERKVESSCIHCNKCVDVCPFDAIKPDFTTRVTDCTFCQTCGGVCPVHAIKYVERWNRTDLKPANDPATGETKLGRRGFLTLATGVGAGVLSGAAASFVTRRAFPATNGTSSKLPVRPPGSVPEEQFLQLCIRCAQCFKVCPNNVLQPLDLRGGLNALWTPAVNADWAGCESSCNACGQVCPTGAIRALPLEIKREQHMGLAVVNRRTCLPYANREACQLCVDECKAAGYDAIEFMQVHTAIDSDGMPVAGSGFVAPVVLADRCVGCGLCQARCYALNVKEKRLLKHAAIEIEVG